MERPREKLDVPGVTPLEQKLAGLTRQRPSIGPAPRSAMLDQLAAFLPRLAQENKKLEEELQAQPPAEPGFVLERVDDEAGPAAAAGEPEAAEGEGGGEGTYIEMDLACGVLDLRDDAALQAAEAAMAGRGGALLGQGAADSGSDDSDDSDSDDSDDLGDADSEDGSDESYSRGEVTEGVAGQGQAGGRGAGAGVGAGAEAGEDAMECEGDEGQGQDGGAGAALRGPRGRSGLGVGPPGRRRKVAAKRKKLVQEL
ncbi:hypothetical protein HYH03_002905 [Edaphochlamys debaryana]|uniref:Uncharacterized protein n=1 Tax=Edaphochlamys debaryana TaxID=47281 RepID=A0A835YDM2_9CHLO|nr:hypothetical protein HYH03_002905 [Edaphochlamys debaryana]|eukprot:KAG2499328.1 hypothetical protein HYH03_002905 [Edaphochlamys debaryana]